MTKQTWLSQGGLSYRSAVSNTILIKDCYQVLHAYAACGTCHTLTTVHAAWQDHCSSDQAVCDLCTVECRSQHIFINPEMPRNAHGMSYNCIGFDGNQRSFNDGYHTIHHLNSKLHWTQLPQQFIRCKQQQSLPGNKLSPSECGYQPCVVDTELCSH